MSRANLKDILEAIDEVTSGVWFRETGRHQFEIDKAVLPLAIGLALHSELKSLTTEEEIDSSADRFLGPMEDQSLGVNILAAVIVLSFLDKDYPALGYPGSVAALDHLAQLFWGVFPASLAHR